MSDNNLPFIDVRAVFEKKGAAVYFSHLDLSRTAARALRRSGMDIWMTKGFTPRPHLVFTPPLSLGYMSECEVMDFRLNLGAELDTAALKKAFPEALKIKEVYYPENKIKEIAYARWRITVDTAASARDIAELFSKPLVLLKKTKRSEQEVDITAFIRSLECTKTGDTVTITTVLDCSSDSTLSPAYLIQGIESNGIEIKKTTVTRLAFLDKSMQLFR